MRAHVNLTPRFPEVGSQLSGLGPFRFNPRVAGRSGGILQQNQMNKTPQVSPPPNSHLQFPTLKDASEAQMLKA